MSNPILIYNARLVDFETDEPGAVFIVEGKIRSVFKGIFTTSQTVTNFAKAILNEDGYREDTKIELYDAKGFTLTPAFIDMHTHMRYPGQTQKEDFNSGLHAAVAGGYGTIVAMANTNPVVSSFEDAVKLEKEAASLGLAHLIQVVSITKNFDGQTIEHLKEIDPKYVPVISEDGRDVLSSAVMLDAMKIAAEKGLIVSCHSEDPSLAAQAKPYREQAIQLFAQKGESAKEEIKQLLDKANDLLRAAEDVATKRNLQLAKTAGCKIHIAHVSTVDSFEAILKAQREGVQVTYEITPHHLSRELQSFRENMTTNQIYDFVNPPVRGKKDVERLFTAFMESPQMVISTDHAPHTMEDKSKGSPGFTGLEVAYAYCHNAYVQTGIITDSNLSLLMSAKPAEILGLKKGRITTGYDADLTLVNPDEKWEINTAEFYSKGKYTPFNGMEVTGRVKAVFIDGRLVFEKQAK